MSNKKDEEIDQLINIIETMIPLTINNASVDLQNAWRKLVAKHRDKEVEVCRHKTPRDCEYRSRDPLGAKKKLELER